MDESKLEVMAQPTLRWPPAADEPRLAKIETGIVIARPADVVFAFATNASLWHHWHPATEAVSGVENRPLVVGDTVTESIRAAGRRFSATWTVLACEAPTLWVIATRTGEGDARIVYEVRSEGARSRFIRTLQCRSRRWPWSALDGNLTRWVLARQSERALTNLKQVLEGGLGSRDGLGTPLA
jgi:uncharacterized protein YndB with AHSA1/START domain